MPECRPSHLVGSAAVLPSATCLWHPSARSATCSAASSTSRCRGRIARSEPCHLQAHLILKRFGVPGHFRTLPARLLQVECVPPSQRGVSALRVRSELAYQAVRQKVAGRDPHRSLGISGIKRSSVREPPPPSQPVAILTTGPCRHVGRLLSCFAEQRPF